MVIKKSTFLKLFLLIIVFILYISLLACKSEVSTNQKHLTNKKILIKIGAIIPLTGPVADMGEAFRYGLELAFAEISKNTNFRYKLLIEDDQLSPVLVANAAQKLINREHVQAIISTWSYGGNIVAPIASKKNVPHFAVAWDPNIIKSGENNFLHLVSPDVFIPDFFSVFKAHQHQRLGLIYFAEAGSLYCAEKFKQQATKEGMTIAHEVELPPSPDLRTIALQFVQAQPDIIFANLVGSDLASLIKQLKALNYQGKITTMTGFDLMPDLELANESWFISDSAISMKVDRRNTYGIGNYYDFVKIIVNVFESWKKPTSPSSKWVINQIKNTQINDSAFGKLYFSKNKAVYPVKYYFIRDGKKIEVKLKQLQDPTFISKYPKT